MIKFTSLLKVLAFAFAVHAASVFAAGQFFLADVRNGTTFGPYTLYDGAKIRLGGILYDVSVKGNDRVSFVSAADKSAYGPFQTVDGRIMRVGGVSYTFGWKDGGSASSRTSGKSSAKADVKRPVHEAPIAEFAPLPPKPEMIAVPEPEQQRQVKPLDMPALPDASRPLTLAAWLAPLDQMPVEWKIASAKGSDSDIKRTTFGLSAALNSWFAETSLSTGVKCDEIIPDGLGISNSAMDDGSGWSIGIGYKRPFLAEGNVVASAGLFGRIRQDKGDLSATTFVATGEADTNDLGNVYSKVATSKSSVKITETTLRVDLELAYVEEFWRVFIGVLIQPISDMDVSASIQFADESLKVSATHDDPIAVRVGGWYELNDGWSLAADLMIGMESQLRLGVMREF